MQSFASTLALSVFAWQSFIYKLLFLAHSVLHGATCFADARLLSWVSIIPSDVCHTALGATQELERSLVGWLKKQFHWIFMALIFSNIITMLQNCTVRYMQSPQRRSQQLGFRNRFGQFCWIGIRLQTQLESPVALLLLLLVALEDLGDPSCQSTAFWLKATSLARSRFALKGT